jgi:ubiquinone biosynthesis accessory factor UbiJ
LENPHLCGFFTLMNTNVTSTHLFAAEAACRGINHVLAAETWALSELEKHSGKTMLLKLPLGDLGFEISATGFLKGLQEANQPSLTLEVSTKVLSDLASSSGNLRKKAFKAVKITGDADLAQLLGRLAGQLRWEYEEDLARLIGDAPAHFAVRQGKKLLSSSKSAAADLLDNVVEYVSEERKVLLNKRDFMTYKSALNDLRESVDRIEKRIFFLEQKAQ